MSFTDTQAAPFTRENAAEMARRATISREANRAARAISLANDSTRPFIEPEVHRLVKALSKLPVTSDDYVRLSGVLDKLWSKAFPTQGSARPSKQSRRSQVEAQPIQTPQDIAPEPAKPARDMSQEM